jgi:hypothetical protein
MRYIPHWLVVLAIVVIVIIILALIIGALGGFQWLLQVGHFHLDVGVTKAAAGG